MADNTAIENRMANLELNNEIKVEIDTTPTAQSPTWADMGNAFKNVSTAVNEVVYSATYLADKGFGSSAVVGAAPTLSLTGDFIKGDAVCEYFDDIQYEIGSKRCTKIRMTRNEHVVTCGVTFTALALTGGESSAPNGISVTIAFNGKPTRAEATESGT